MQKVGFSKVGSNKRLLTYKKVPCVKGEWVDANKYLPNDFDLLLLKIKDKPIISGWCVGKKWDGLKYKRGDIVTHWKRKHEMHRD